jgi:hypothetical protein
MDIKHARLLKKSLNSIIDTMDVPLHIAQNFGDDETRKNLIDILGQCICHIDYDIIDKINKKFPDLAEEDKKDNP